jgi:hypothetical protein
MAEWTNETTQTALEMVKVDIGIINATAYDNRLRQYIETAKSAIIREGATLSDEVEDIQLVAMYAGWLWRKRDTGDGMPRNLRWMLNNRILSEKARS